MNTSIRTPAGTALPVAKGAPNVIWILLDDVGYGASSAFGGGARTPVLEDLARNGLTYTNFNTTAVCSPSRAALLTGRNHHMVGMGLLPRDGTIAEYLRARGYSTYMLGKWHLTTQLTDKAIFYIDRQQQLNPGKPFWWRFAVNLPQLAAPVL